MTIEQAGEGFFKQHIAADIRRQRGKNAHGQIDLAPTLLGLLNLDYQSTFFGRNLLQDNPLPPRV